MTPISPCSFPAVAEALLSGASAQLRNAATVGGNLMQRTRCRHFADPASACNRRAPGAGCDAIGGETRGHAVLGWSDACIATHPSDFCVPLVAFDAVVEIEGAAGRREVALEDFHLLPGTTPERENALAPGELIVSAAPAGRSGGVPRPCPLSQAARPHLLRLRRGLGRRRADASRTARSPSARLALGGVAASRGAPARPRRCWSAPPPTAPRSNMPPRPHWPRRRRSGGNGFKIELAKRIVTRALALRRRRNARPHCRRCPRSLFAPLGGHEHA